MKEEQVDQRRKPDLLFRYSQAKIIVLGDNTITFEVTERGSQRSRWCVYYQHQKKVLEEAIRCDSFVNLLVARYIVKEGPEPDADSRIDDILENVWIIHGD